MKVFFRTTSNHAGKFRPDWFSYEACFKTVLNEFGTENVTVFFDGAEETVQEYIRTSGVRVVLAKEGGSETKSFRELLEYLKDSSALLDSEPLDKGSPLDEIVYIVEDDYLHRPGSSKVLSEAFEGTNIDYATLYDHMDKYFYGYFEKFAIGFKTSLVPTKTCHWRTTPSTTNTFATRYKTLMDDFDIHMKYSPISEKTSRDHEKFFELWKKGRSLVSSVPGYSTHVENELMSPCTDWEALSNSPLLSSDASLSIDPLDDSVAYTSA